VIKWKEYEVINFIIQFHAKYCKQGLTARRAWDPRDADMKGGSGEKGAFDKPSNAVYDC
jgi:hypothetical protein